MALSDTQIKLAFDLYEDGYKLKSFTPNNVATFVKENLTVKIIPKL